MAETNEPLPEIPHDPAKAFAYLVSRCANGLLAELVHQEGKTEDQAKNILIHYFLDFAAGEACRMARRLGRDPDHKKWSKAVDNAFDRAVKRTSPTPEESRG